MEANYAGEVNPSLTSLRSKQKTRLDALSGDVLITPEQLKCKEARHKAGLIL